MPASSPAGAALADPSSPGSVVCAAVKTTLSTRIVSFIVMRSDDLEPVADSETIRRWAVART